MGKHSPESKRRQRKKQKVRRNLTFVQKCPGECSNDTATVSPELSTDSTVVSEDSDQVSYHDDRGEHTHLGVDLDVVEMTLKDKLMQDSEEYTHTYLKDCRKRLMLKVNSYRREIERLNAEKTSLIHAHKQQLDSVRSFYQNIAYGMSRTGRIVRTSIQTGKASTKMMEELAESTYCRYNITK